MIPKNINDLLLLSKICLYIIFRHLFYLGVIYKKQYTYLFWNIHSTVVINVRDVYGTCFFLEVPFDIEKKVNIFSCKQILAHFNPVQSFKS